MRRAGILTLAVLVVAAVGQGCTKRVPWEDPIDPRKTLVLVFADGSEIRGKINLDEGVELTKDGTIYRGLIEDVSDEEIELRDCRFVRRSGGVWASQQRMASARTDLGVENIDSIVFQRKDVVSIDQVQVDALKSASRSVFSIMAVAVAAFLAAEKS
jgi:hypothetical protein